MFCLGCISVFGRVFARSGATCAGDGGEPLRFYQQMFARPRHFAQTLQCTQLFEQDREKGDGLHRLLTRELNSIGFSAIFVKVRASIRWSVYRPQGLLDGGCCRRGPTSFMGIPSLSSGTPTTCPSVHRGCCVGQRTDMAQVGAHPLIVAVGIGKAEPFGNGYGDLAK